MSILKLPALSLKNSRDLCLIEARLEAIPIYKLTIYLRGDHNLMLLSATAALREDSIRVHILLYKRYTREKSESVVGT